MATDKFRDLDALAHGLVLLQEICQGYDNPIYRGRAERYIAAGGSTQIGNYLLPKWFHGGMSTPEFIDNIEKALIHDVTER